MIKFVVIAIFVIVGLGARSQDSSLLFRHHVALKLSEGPAVLQQCSRSSPQHVTGLWEVSPDTVALVERNFWRLRGPFAGSTRNKPASHADSMAYVHHFDGNQYIGVVIGGQRYVYINHVGEDLADCRTRACIICDGGFGFWGALFNVATLEFSEESFNGPA
ncbi:MAG TPA: hypothetical protein VGS79_21585 [Puia sp.]|nr:hypothetical protein [Puia sp.]